MLQPTTTVPTRLESDSMGTVEVPTNVYWGAQTARSLIHFSIGHDRMPPELIWAFRILKKAAALMIEALGKLQDATSLTVGQEISSYVNNPLMLVTALSPKIGL